MTRGRTVVEYRVVRMQSSQQAIVSASVSSYISESYTHSIVFRRLLGAISRPVCGWRLGSKFVGLGRRLGFRHGSREFRPACVGFRGVTFHLDFGTVLTARFWHGSGGELAA